MIFSCNI